MNELKELKEQLFFFPYRIKLTAEYFFVENS